MPIIDNPIIIGGGGTSLEELSNPAAEKDVLTDKEYYDDQGVKHVGSANFIGGEQPRLNTPGFSHNGSSLSISNPSTNGNFCNGYKLYKDGELFKEQTTTSFNLYDLENGKYEFFVRCKGTNFQDSESSDHVMVAIFSVKYRLRGLTASSTSTVRLTNNAGLSLTITPVLGTFLPETVGVFLNGNKLPHTYDSYSGAISVHALGLDYPVVPPDGSKLGRPFLENSLSHDISFGDVTFAENYELYCDEDVFQTIEGDPQDDFLCLIIDACTYDIAKLRKPKTGVVDDYIALSLIIIDLRNAETYDIYVDGEIKTSITAIIKEV